jgi:protein subunit release factor B
MEGQNRNMNESAVQISHDMEGRKKTFDEVEAVHNRSVLANKMTVPELHADGSGSHRIEEQKQLREKTSMVIS